MLLGEITEEVLGMIEANQPIPAYGFEEPIFTELKWEFLGETGAETVMSHSDKVSFLRSDSFVLTYHSEKIEILKVEAL